MQHHGFYKKKLFKLIILKSKYLYYVWDDEFHENIKSSISHLLDTFHLWNNYIHCTIILSKYTAHD